MIQSTEDERGTKPARSVGCQPEKQFANQITGVPEEESEKGAESSFKDRTVRTS